MAGKTKVMNVLESMGRPLADQLDAGREIWVLFVQTLRYSFSGPRPRASVLTQVFEIGNRSLVFITVTLGVLGMISIFQVATQVARVIPDFSMVGAAFLRMLIREFGPTMCGLMVATRTGSAIAAEIGSMVVTEQVDALRMCNADPIRFLVVPRFIACGPTMVILAIFGISIATLTGMVTGAMGFGISPGTFFNWSLVQWQDVVVGATKALAYGFAIPIFASHAGLQATGGSEGVGAATTRAVVNCCFSVIVLDLILSGVGYIFLSP